MTLWVIVLLVSVVFESATAQRVPEGTGANPLPPGLSQRHREGILKYLRPALMATVGAGRVYYTTVCASQDGPLNNPLVFPEVKVGPATGQRIGLTAVREIFK